MNSDGYLLIMPGAVLLFMVIMGIRYWWKKRG